MLYCEKRIASRRCLCSSGVFFVLTTNTVIRCMIKETDGNHFEKMRSLEQNLTFEYAKTTQVHSQKDVLEEKVITLTKERGFVTRKEVEIFPGISQSSCGRLLKKMIENGQIVQEGKGKSTHYCLPK